METHQPGQVFFGDLEGLSYVSIGEDTAGVRLPNCMGEVLRITILISIMCSELRYRKEINIGLQYAINQP